MWLFFNALWQLTVFDTYLVRKDFAGLHQRVQDCIVQANESEQNSIERVCWAVNFACMWYPKRSLCLQKSAATTCLLRERGVPAHLIIGAQKLPFRAHAWVEVDGQVVNDNSDVQGIYSILDRC
jgi:hypothetical protein